MWTTKNAIIEFTYWTQSKIKNKGLKWILSNNAPHEKREAQFNRAPTLAAQVNIKSERSLVSP